MKFTQHHGPLRVSSAALAASALLLASAAAVHADAPNTRGTGDAPHGAVGAAATWQHVQPLPPLGGAGATSLPPPRLDESGAVAHVPVPAPALLPAAQTPAQDGLRWLTRQLNPGNWVMDAGLGVLTGSLGTMNDSLLVALKTFIPLPTTPETAQAIPFSCSGNPGIQLLLCTHPDILTSAVLTSGAPNPVNQRLTSIWTSLRQAVMVLITTLFAIRMVRLALAGQRSMAIDGRAALTDYALALGVVAGAPVLIRGILLLFYSINDAILAGAAQNGGTLLLPLLGATSAPAGTLLYFGDQFAILLVSLGLLVMFAIALVRLVRIFILLCLAPLAGATLIDRSTAHYFRAWLEKLIELLLHQTGWAIAFAIGIGIAKPILDLGDGQPPAGTPQATINSAVVSLTVIAMALFSRSLFDGLITRSGVGGVVTAWTIKHARDLVQDRRLGRLEQARTRSSASRERRGGSTSSTGSGWSTGSGSPRGASRPAPTPGGSVPPRPRPAPHGRDNRTSNGAPPRAVGGSGARSSSGDASAGGMPSPGDTRMSAAGAAPATTQGRLLAALSSPPVSMTPHLMRRTLVNVRRAAGAPPEDAAAQRIQRTRLPNALRTQLRDTAAAALQAHHRQGGLAGDKTTTRIQRWMADHEAALQARTPARLRKRPALVAKRYRDQLRRFASPHRPVVPPATPTDAGRPSDPSDRIVRDGQAAAAPQQPPAGPPPPAAATPTDPPPHQRPARPDPPPR